MGTMIANWIVDHIPMWVWITLTVAAVGAAFYFFSPILVPIWNRLPTWLRAFLIGATAVVIAFLGGRYRGRANAEEEERRRNAEALRKRAEVDASVDKASDEDVDKRLDRWRRD
jgi:hypothetical protein